MATWGGYDKTIEANRFQRTYIVNYVDVSGQLLVRNGDVSLNNRLFVINDVSFASNLYVDDILCANVKLVSNNDISLNNRLFVINDGSFASNLYVDDILTSRLQLIANGNVSLNKNVLVGNDISCNGNMNIGKNLIVNGNIGIKNYTAQNVISTTTTNYMLVIAEDISLNGRLCVSNDTSFNGNLFVSGDISLNGQIKGNVINFVKDISVNGMNIGIGKGNYTNLVVGNLALSTNTAGINCTAVGYQSLFTNTGSSNSACGYQSLYSNTTGVENSAIGSRALYSNTSGTDNTAIGYQAGYAGATPNTIGSNNVFIGNQATSSANNYSRCIAIGAGAVATGNNQIVLGTSMETIFVAGQLTHTYSPIYIYKPSAVQSIVDNSSTWLLFATNEVSSTYSGITYSAGTFTNSKSYTVGVSISCTVTFAAGSGTGKRAVFVETSNFGRLAKSELFASSGTIYSPSFTSTFVLTSGATFRIVVNQSSGAALSTLITTTTASPNPTRLCIRVF
jgi:hypothetical protein